MIPISVDSLDLVFSLYVHGVDNLRLPDVRSVGMGGNVATQSILFNPTHAFIGGSTGQLKEIIQCIKKKNPDVRIVINAISLETVKEAMEAMEEGLLADPEIIQLNVAKSKKLGRYHMMTGLNPIYIISDGGDIE